MFPEITLFFLYIYEPYKECTCTHDGPLTKHFFKMSSSFMKQFEVNT